MVLSQRAAFWAGRFPEGSGQGHRVNSVKVPGRFEGGCRRFPHFLDLFWQSFRKFWEGSVGPCIRCQKLSGKVAGKVRAN